MKIGKILKDKRKLLNLKQIQLAPIIKVTPAYISQVESDKKMPSIPILMEMCAAFNTTIAEVFYEAQGLKSYKDGIRDATKVVKGFLQVVEWATYFDLEKLLETSEEISNSTGN